MGFSADAFIVIVLACVSSTVLSHHLLGTTLSLSLPYLDLSGDAQLGWVALLGAVGGGVGIGFMRLRFVILDALTRADMHALLDTLLTDTGATTLLVDLDGTIDLAEAQAAAYRAWGVEALDPAED